MSRKQQVTETISKFLKATRVERRSMLSFGVEFEYQVHSESEWCECLQDLDFEQEYDIDRMHAAEYEMACETFDRISEMIDYINISDIDGDKLGELHNEYDDLRPLLLCGKPATHALLKELLGRRSTSQYVRNRIERYLQYIVRKGIETDSLDLCAELGIDQREVHESIREDVEIDDLSPYQYDPDYLRGQYCECDGGNRCNEPEGTEYDTDQSVSGGELRTVGAFSYSDLLRTGKQMLDSIADVNGVYTDKSCSAHLHVQLGSIKHYFGEGNLHRCIMEYLALNMHLMPECVLQRLEGGGNRHIKPQFVHDKFSWVHFHGQGTIEFRLFGNITDIDDLERCMQIACDALAYAYRMRKRRRKVNAAALLRAKELNELYQEYNLGPYRVHVLLLSNTELRRACMDHRFLKARVA